MSEEGETFTQYEEESAPPRTPPPQGQLLSATENVSNVCCTINMLLISAFMFVGYIK